MENFQIEKYIKNNFLKIIARPNAPETKIIKWDEARQALRVDVHAQPEKDRANKEIIKFFSKLTGKKAEIASGGAGKIKRIKFV